MRLDPLPPTLLDKLDLEFVDLFLQELLDTYENAQRLLPKSVLSPPPNVLELLYTTASFFDRPVPDGTPERPQRDINVTPNLYTGVKVKLGRPLRDADPMTGFDYFAACNPAGMTLRHIGLSIDKTQAEINDIRARVRRRCPPGERMKTAKNIRHPLPIDTNTGFYYHELENDTARRHMNSPLYCYHAWAWGRQLYARYISQGGTLPTTRCPISNLSARRLLDEDLQPFDLLGQDLPNYVKPSNMDSIELDVAGWRLAIYELLWLDRKPLKRRVAYRARGTDPFSLRLNHLWGMMQDRWENYHHDFASNSPSDATPLAVNHHRRIVVDAADPYGAEPIAGSGRPVKFWPAIPLKIEPAYVRLHLPVPAYQSVAHRALKPWRSEVKNSRSGNTHLRDYTTVNDLASMILHEICEVAGSGGTALAFALFREAERYAQGTLNQPIDDEHYTGVKVANVGSGNSEADILAVLETPLFASTPKMTTPQPTMLTPTEPLNPEASGPTVEVPAIYKETAAHAIALVRAHKIDDEKFIEIWNETNEIAEAETGGSDDMRMAVNDLFHTFWLTWGEYA